MTPLTLLSGIEHAFIGVQYSENVDADRFSAANAVFTDQLTKSMTRKTKELAFEMYTVLFRYVQAFEQDHDFQNHNVDKYETTPFRNQDMNTFFKSMYSLPLERSIRRASYTRVGNKTEEFKKQRAIAVNDLEAQYRECAATWSTLKTFLNYHVGDFPWLLDANVEREDEHFATTTNSTCRWYL